MNDQHVPTESIWRRSASAGLLSISRQVNRFRRLRGAGLRILGYHGVCDDRDAGKPWTPDYFVSISSFERQIAYIAQNSRVVFIPDVLDALCSDPVSLDGCVAVTFDDVAACTVCHAIGVLDRFAIKASFFVSTGHVSTGRLFDADVIRLLRWNPQLAGPCMSQALGELLETDGRFKNKTLTDLRHLLDGPQRRVRAAIGDHVSETLRPVNWSELRRLAESGHEIGAHTVDHAILGAQSPYVRGLQIADSVRELEVGLGQAPIGFAYPNGGPDDFDESDASALRGCGVQYALSTRAGVCETARDIHNLPRTCIGMGHTPTSFALELTGILDRRRRRQQGWR